MDEAFDRAGMSSKVVEHEVGEEVSVCASDSWCRALSQLRNFTVVTYN